MRKYVLQICLLLFMVLPIFGIPFEQTEEYAEKQAILNEKAARFIADTGFSGEIVNNHKRMKLGYYEGIFSDIQFSAGADTTAFRQVCNRILDKVMPYSLAKRSQLSMSIILNGGRFTNTHYYQVVNGFKVEYVGFISIAYDSDMSRFHIGENTVELPEEAKLDIITPTEAEQIALRDMNIEHYSRSKVYNLFYSSEGSDSYYLAYLVVVSSTRHESDDSYTYWIDALTGQIKESRISIIIRD